MEMAANIKGPKSPVRHYVVVTILCVFLLAIFVVILNLSWSPIYKGLGPDSGLYAYVGNAILHGQLPYRDVWEQKPPIGLYLNALAVLLFGRNPWAIWWFNLIWITLSAGAIFLVIKKMMGVIAGGIASVIFILAVMSPSIFQGGNLMEIYGLLPQVVIIGCTYCFFATKRNRWTFLGGLVTGIAFMTKQTTIALGISSLFVIIVVTLLLHEFKDLWVRLAGFIAGFLIPVGVALTYWFSVGALNDFLDAVFLHSISYVSIGAPFLWSIGYTFLRALPKLFISKLYCIAALSFLLYLAENLHWFLGRLFPNRNLNGVAYSNTISPVEFTLLAVFIALPLEVVFASLGGRNFGHYFLSLIPAVTTAVAYVFFKVVTFLRSSRFGVTKPHTWMAVGGIVLALLSVVWMARAMIDEAPTKAQIASLPAVFRGQYEMDDLQKYIIATTAPPDAVMVWHIHVGLNFITDRRPPQRVLFPANLFTSANTSRSGFSEFLKEFEKAPPTLIIVQKVSSLGLPFVNVPLEQMCPNGACMPEFAQAMKSPDIYSELQLFRQYFLEHYTLDTQIYDWLIYKHIP